MTGLITTLAQKHYPKAFAMLAYVVLIAFGVKLPIFPLHTWLPDAHSEACAPVVVELEKKLDATLDVVGRLVKALDYMRSDDARFIFEMDLVKHCLYEPGYLEGSESSAHNPS